MIPVVQCNVMYDKYHFFAHPVRLAKREPAGASSYFGRYSLPVPQRVGGLVGLGCLLHTEAYVNLVKFGHVDFVVLRADRQTDTLMAILRPPAGDEAIKYDRHLSNFVDQCFFGSELMQHCLTKLTGHQ